MFASELRSSIVSIVVGIICSIVCVIEKRRKKISRATERRNVPLCVCTFSIWEKDEKKTSIEPNMWAGEMCIVGDRKIDRSSACPAFKHMGFFFLNVAQGIKSTHTRTFTFFVRLYWSSFHSVASCVCHDTAELYVCFHFFLLSLSRFYIYAASRIELNYYILR